MEAKKLLLSRQRTLGSEDVQHGCAQHNAMHCHVMLFCTVLCKQRNVLIKSWEQRFEDIAID